MQASSAARPDESRPSSYNFTTASISTSRAKLASSVFPAAAPDRAR